MKCLLYPAQSERACHSSSILPDDELLPNPLISRTTPQYASAGHYVQSHFRSTLPLHHQNTSHHPPPHSPPAPRRARRLKGPHKAKSFLEVASWWPSPLRFYVPSVAFTLTSLALSCSPFESAFRHRRICFISRTEVLHSLLRRLQRFSTSGHPEALVACYAAA